MAIWHGKCFFSGLSIDQDSDGNEWSPVFIQDSVGTPRMSVENGQLIWKNDRWGSWLACARNGQVQLLYWDVSTNQGIDTGSCAKVQLITELV